MSLIALAFSYFLRFLSKCSETLALRMGDISYRSSESAKGDQLIILLVKNCILYSCIPKWLMVLINELC